MNTIEKALHVLTNIDAPNALSACQHLIDNVPDEYALSWGLLELKNRIRLHLKLLMYYALDRNEYTLDKVDRNRVECESMIKKCTTAYYETDREVIEKANYTKRLQNLKDKRTLISGKIIGSNVNQHISLLKLNLEKGLPDPLLFDVTTEVLTSKVGESCKIACHELQQASSALLMETATKEEILPQIQNHLNNVADCIGFKR